MYTVGNWCENYGVGRYVTHFMACACLMLVIVFFARSVRSYWWGPENENDSMWAVTKVVGSVGTEWSY